MCTFILTGYKAKAINTKVKANALYYQYKAMVIKFGLKAKAKALTSLPIIV
jgi:hypothetical protein